MMRVVGLPWMMGRLARWLYPYGSVRPVLRGPWRGFRYVVEPGMGATFALGLADYHADFIARHVSPGMTVYYVGANRGQMALLLSRLVGPAGCVVSLEPVPALHQSLRRNLALNGVANVDCRCLAVADASGRRPFLFDDEACTQGKLAGVEPTYRLPGARRLDVDAASLDDLVDAGAPPPDFLKVDVEGGAAAVLRGAARVLARSAPSIYVELHGPEEQRGVRDSLMSAGYRIERLTGEPVLDPTARWESPLFGYRQGGGAAPRLNSSRSTSISTLPA
jgi:FkbM family methyltransferase